MNPIIVDRTHLHYAQANTHSHASKQARILVADFSGHLQKQTVTMLETLSP